VVRVPGTQAGTYYLLAYADTLASQPTPFTLLAELLPFALTGVTPNHGGNAGNVTLRLTGSGITSNSTAKLVYLGSNAVPVEVVPIRTRRVNMGEMFATFDLNGAIPAIADVVLVGDAGQSNTSQSAFHIEVGQPENIQLRVFGPTGLRPGGAPGNYRAFVRNSSNEDAEFVTLSAWIPNDSRVSIKVEGALPLRKAFDSRGGFVSYALPRVLVDDEVEFRYQLAVAGSYSAESLAATWQVQTLERSVFVNAMARSTELQRVQILNVTNLQTDFPEVYALASDPGTWRAFAAEQMRSIGFEISADELAPSTQNRALTAKAEKAPGFSGDDLACNIVCDLVFTMLCIEGGPGLAIVCSVISSTACYFVCLPPPPQPPPPWCPYEVYVSGGTVSGLICTPRSRDPTRIVGPTGWGDLAYLGRDVTFPYLIEFENRPEAGGAVVQVTITNHLGPELDWKTFALTEIGFAGVKLPAPDGMSHFEARVPFTGWTWNSSNGWHRGQTPLMVDVKAGLDIETGLITLTLTCSDTNTGAFPEDAFAGFLPPNKPELAYYETNTTGCCGPVDTNVLIQPGQGYVSYTVRPQTNQPSGTVITNAARIVFDWNDPIDTPPVFNTLDAAPPVSTVLPLPAESGRTFLVRWAGQDDPGGSGVASYDVHVSADGLNYSRWLQGTNGTAAYFVGELGRTYSFYSVSRDWVGHEEAKPLGAQRWTTVSTNSPVLARISAQTVIPNSQTDLHKPSQRWHARFLPVHAWPRRTRWS
jgi:hypothetical protein